MCVCTDARPRVSRGCRGKAHLILGSRRAGVGRPGSWGPSQPPGATSVTCHRSYSTFSSFQALFLSSKPNHTFLTGWAMFERFFNSCKMTERKVRNSDKQTVDKWYFIVPTWIIPVAILKRCAVWCSIFAFRIARLCQCIVHACASVRGPSLSGRCRANLVQIAICLHIHGDNSIGRALENASKCRTMAVLATEFPAFWTPSSVAVWWHQWTDHQMFVKWASN